MQRQLVQRFPLLGMLYSLLAFAWLQASYAARDLAEAQPSSLHGCTTTINSAWQLNRELVNLQTKSLRVCLDPADDRCVIFLCAPIDAQHPLHWPLHAVAASRISHWAYVYDVSHGVSVLALQRCLYR